MFVTHLRAPGGMGSVELHPQALGVWYDERGSAWADLARRAGRRRRLALATPASGALPELPSQRPRR